MIGSCLLWHTVHEAVANDPWDSTNLLGLIPATMKHIHVMQLLWMASLVRFDIILITEETP